jgi:tocopherol O-methyltransferase
MSAFVPLPALHLVSRVRNRGFENVSGRRFMRENGAVRVFETNRICPHLPISMRMKAPDSINLFPLHTYDPSTGLRVVNVPGVSRAPRSRLLVVIGVAIAILAYFRRRLMRIALRKPYARPNLDSEIADFYDKRSQAWEAVWGEHMHHGLYFGAGGKTENPKKGREAQVETMEELLRMAGLISPSALGEKPKILDVGCGIGGASRFLARKFPAASVTGITLSSLQARRAQELNAQAGLDGRVSNVVCDALNSGLPDDSFDLVWSLESAEHMGDKHRLISECKRILKPGGTLLMVAWCMRESYPPLKELEQFSLRKIMQEYCLPRLAPPSEYATNMRRLGLRHISQEDWTERAAPFWGEVAWSAIANPKGWKALREYGWPLIRSALAMRHVMSAIRMGCFKLTAFYACKPTLAAVREEADRMASLTNC